MSGDFPNLVYVNLYMNHDPKQEFNHEFTFQAESNGYIMMDTSILAPVGISGSTCQLNYKVWVKIK